MAFVRCPSSFTPVESEPRSRSPLPGFHAWSFRPFPNLAKPEAYDVSCRERRKVEMLFAHLKRILKLGRWRLRGPNGAKDEFLLAATAQNLRKLGEAHPSSDTDIRHMRPRGSNSPR